MQKNHAISNFPPPTNNRFFWIATIGLLSLFSVVNAFLNDINHDVAYYIYLVGQWLGGSELYVDLTDPNPPLILYLSVPPLVVSLFTGLPEIPVYKCYTLLLVILSLVLSFRLLKNIYSSVTPAFRFFFLFCLVYVLVEMPGYDFAQREHLLTILTLPYFISSMGRLEKRPLKRSQMFWAGLLAGLGFSLKPYFVLPFLAVEAILLVFKGVKPAWRKLESIVIAAVLVLYALSVVVLTPGYLDIIKINLQVYDAYNRPLSFILIQLIDLNVILPCALFIILTPPKRIAYMPIIFFILTLVYVLVCIIQHKGFTYHYLPIKSSAALLFTSTVLAWMEKGSPLRGAHRIIVPIALIFAVLFSLYSTVRNIYVLKDKEPQMAERLADVCRPALEGKYILAFSSSVKPSFPLVNYLDAAWAMKFGCLWWIPGLYGKDDVKKGVTRYHTKSEMNEIEKNIYESIIDDVERLRPGLILIDAKQRKQGFQVPFDYLDYFLQDERFRKLWERYEYLDKVNHYKIYRYR